MEVGHATSPEHRKVWVMGLDHTAQFTSSFCKLLQRLYILNRGHGLGIPWPYLTLAEHSPRDAASVHMCRIFNPATVIGTASVVTLLALPVVLASFFIKVPMTIKLFCSHLGAMWQSRQRKWAAIAPAWVNGMR